MTNAQPKTPAAAAAADYDRAGQDVGNILGLEHVNLTITDRDLANRFYVSGLGFTYDPYIDLGSFGTTWVNLGSQQMHLVHAPQAQRLRGRVGLVVPDPEAAIRRLDRMMERVPEVADSAVGHTMSNGELLVTGPWGNTFRLHGPDEIEGFELGMPYVEMDIEPGRAAGVAAFYAEVMGSPTVIETDPAPTAVVAAGRRQQIRFRETDKPISDYDGHHIAIYLNNFSRPYDELLGRGLITRETDENEYRFTDIVDPENGEPCAVIEHEVRSMFHPMFGRELVNRQAGQGLGRRYRQGHDTQPGLHLSGLG